MSKFAIALLLFIRMLGFPIAQIRKLFGLSRLPQISNHDRHQVKFLGVEDKPKKRPGIDADPLRPEVPIEDEQTHVHIELDAELIHF